jgi:hypothetical protein
VTCELSQADTHVLYAKENDVDLEKHFGGKAGLKEASSEDIGEYLVDRWNESDGESPMMNYFYPIHIGWNGSISAEDAQFILSVNHLCLTVIRMMDEDIEHEYVLALTGGGMDLRWEICEAFCLLGQIPPSCMADVPDMSGRGMSPRDQWILECIRIGAEADVTQAASRLASVKEKAKRGKRDLRRRSAGKKPYYAAGGYIAFGNMDAARNCKEFRGYTAVIYELIHKNRDDFRCYFVCDSEESVVALKRKHNKSVRLMYGQCDCTAGYRDEPMPISAYCYECHGQGRKPRCGEEPEGICINEVTRHGEKLCEFHQILNDEKEASGAKQEDVPPTEDHGGGALPGTV